MAIEYTSFIPGKWLKIFCVFFIICLNEYRFGVLTSDYALSLHRFNMVVRKIHNSVV